MPLLLCKVHLLGKAASFKKWVEHRKGNRHWTAEGVANQGVNGGGVEESIYHTPQGLDLEESEGGERSGYEANNGDEQPGEAIAARAGRSPSPQPSTSSGSGAATLARIGGTAAGSSINSMSPGFLSHRRPVTQRVRAACESLQESQQPLPKPVPAVRRLPVGRKRKRDPLDTETHQRTSFVGQRTRSQTKMSREAAAGENAGTTRGGPTTGAARQRKKSASIAALNARKEAEAAAATAAEAAATPAARKKKPQKTNKKKARRKTKKTPKETVVFVCGNYCGNKNKKNPSNDLEIQMNHESMIGNPSNVQEQDRPVQE